MVLKAAFSVVGGGGGGRAEIWCLLRFIVLLLAISCCYGAAFWVHLEAEHHCEDIRRKLKGSSWRIFLEEVAQDIVTGISGDSDRALGTDTGHAWTRGQAAKLSEG